MGGFLESQFYRQSAFPEGFPERMKDASVWEELARRFDRWRQGEARCANPIPRKIHQIWIGKPLPEKYEAFCASWSRLNPSYEYRLWDEKAILELGEFEGRMAFRSARSLGAKSDIARYEILRRFGGVYADTDFECLRPLDRLVDGCSFFAGNLFDPAPYLCNAIIGSAPGHPVANRLCSASSARITTTELMDIIEATGPGLLTREVVGKLDTLEESDLVLPSAYLYPYPNYVGGERDVEGIKREFVTAEAYAIHYWEVSWGKVDFVSFVIRKSKRAVRKIRRVLGGRRDRRGKCAGT